MIYVGLLLGAFVGTFLVSRLILLILEKSGDLKSKIIVTHILILFCATVSYGYQAAGTTLPAGALSYLISFVLYGIPTAIWFVMDMRGLKNRQAKS